MYCEKNRHIFEAGSPRCFCGMLDNPSRTINYGDKKHLLLVFSIDHIEYQTLCARVMDYQKDTGNDIYVLAADGPNQPAIQIWDLDNIQNGEPIPPMIIEKLKEMVNAGPVNPAGD